MVTFNEQHSHKKTIKKVYLKKIFFKITVMKTNITVNSDHKWIWFDYEIWLKGRLLALFNGFKEIALIIKELSSFFIQNLSILDN